MLKAEQSEMLAKITPGEVFEYGHLLSGAAPDEPITWMCLENKELNEGRRVTFHLHYFGVYFAPVVAKVWADGSITWSGSVVCP